MYLQQFPDGGDGEGGAGVGAGVGAGDVPFPFGSKHAQTEQYCVFTSSPQQSPPSQSHPSLLLLSSQ